MPVDTMFYFLYVNILGNNIILLCLCLCLHSVYRLLCLSFAVMFLVCGDVSICIFSTFRNASYKLRIIIITRMTPSCSINNINRIAKFSEYTKIFSHIQKSIACIGVQFILK